MKNDISPASHIIIRGARQHNLKNVDLDLPKGKFIVFTGLSGSGKSSLAFDTIYAEGQRKYVESLSSYARQFLGIMQKPDIDRIEGLSPAISIDQKTTSHNPRSTVGTITEIYDYLRLLFARIGHPHCPDCQLEIMPQTVDQIVISILGKMSLNQNGATPNRWLILSPIIKDKKGEFSGLFDNLKRKGFSRVRVDGHLYSLDDDVFLIKTNRHTIEVVIDRFNLSTADFDDTQKHSQLKRQLSQSLETALDLSEGNVILTKIDDASFDFPDNPRVYEDTLFSQKYACPQCGRSFQELEPRLFSFNTPHGACPECTGLGSILKINSEKIIADDLTLSEGAIIPLASAFSSDSWYARKAAAILETYHLNPKTPFKQFPDEVKKILLYGSRETFQATGPNRRGHLTSFTFQPEGVITELERRYQETQSDYIRSEIERFMRKEICSTCNGTRLRHEALSVTISGKNIAQVTQMPIVDSTQWISDLITNQNHHHPSLTLSEIEISRSILKEINSRLEFLNAVGLSYLSLDREAGTLAGGEAQRIRLASQIGTGLTGVLYVLDEPTIGLHPRDNERLISTLINLRDLNNTVIVVEHDQKVIETADYIVDFGPLAGERGGKVVSQGSLQSIKDDSQSLTGQYLSGKKQIDHNSLLRLASKLHNTLKVSQNQALQGSIILEGARHHNLKDITVEFPLQKLVAVTGVSGSGKATLIHDTLYPALKQHLEQKVDLVGTFTNLKGVSQIKKVYMIDQSPIGRTPRSNPATYSKVFDHIRTVFAQTKDAKIRGFKPGRFSFNVKGGRCEACQGGGQVKISMQFLSDVYITCDICNGHRYNLETLNVLYKGLNISEILDLTVDQAIDIFKNHAPIVKKLATLQAVGLGYITLGQPAPTLSGGEAQRVKLAKELAVNSPGHTLYLLDEPTTGLHFEDTKNLLLVLKQLVKNNNTVIVIEHNLDVIRNADWLIDLGPEGGSGGGQIVAVGTPESFQSQTGYTAQYLKELV
jgi:excinuclease ABC subunit A